METLWNNFDKFYCINLIDRDDRYIYCKNLFKKLGINCEFYRTERNPNGNKGCFESHIAVIKKAYDSGYKNVVIFEDDIIPNKIDIPRLEEVVNFTKTKDWDIFYLGLCPIFFTFPKRIYGNIYSLKNTCAHAYILNRNYMKKLKDLKYKDIGPIDRMYHSDKYSKKRGIFPSMFYQNNFSSNIQNNSIKERFVQNYKPQLLCLYEYFIFYRIQGLISLISLIFLIFLIYFLVKLSKNKNGKLYDN